MKLVIYLIPIIQYRNGTQIALFQCFLNDKYKVILLSVAMTGAS